jgi:hypothetical protein
MTELESLADKRHRIECAQRNKGRIELGSGRRVGLYAAIQRDAMLVHAGVMPKDQAHRDADLTRPPAVAEVAADFLRMAGMFVPQTAAGIIDAALKMANNNVRRAYSRDHFPGWLGDTAQRAVTLGYEEAPETWQYLTRQKSKPDFREFDEVTLPEFPSPAETVENGEVPYMKVGNDSKESSALISHSALFGITRQALTNGDTETITTIPQALGRAANRAVGDKFFSVLVANAAMADGNALFSSAHGNLASSAVAPSVTSLDEARALMTAQRGPSNSILNLRPAIILGPTVMESTITTLRDAMAGSDDDSLTPGYIAGRVAAVTDARLDDADPFAWYAIADPRKHSGIGVYFLEGGELPLVEQRNTFVSDAIDFKLMHDFVVLPVDCRSWVKNPGA